MLEYLEIGKIVNTHGVKGELKVFPLTDNPERYKKLKGAYISDAQGNMVYHEFMQVRFFKNFVLLTLKDITDMNQAEGLKNKILLVNRKDAVKLPEDTYFICDLIGCDIYENNSKIGTIGDVLQTGSNDVYVIKRENLKDLLLPAIKDVILNVDIDSGRIDVKLLKGLEDL